MKTIDLSKATGTLAEYARQLHDEPVIVTRRGKPLAALMTLRGADWESIRVSTDPRFAKILARSRARQRAEGGISSDEMRRRLGLPRRVRRR